MNPIAALFMTFFMAMVPVIELRGAIPAGVAAGLAPWLATLVAIIGNLIPVPFILLFIQKILEFLRRPPKKEQKAYQKLYQKLRLGQIVHKLDQKVEKNRAKIEQYGIPGLILLVAIPIPGTGAWTGSLVAAMLELDKKKSFLAIAAGVTIAGLIFFIGSYAVKTAIDS